MPDTITSWVVSAFSVDPLYGLGLTPQPSKVGSKQPSNQNFKNRAKQKQIDMALFLLRS